jgi:uncharacterized membrane protein
MGTLFGYIIQSAILSSWLAFYFMNISGVGGVAQVVEHLPHKVSFALEKLLMSTYLSSSLYVLCSYVAFKK